MAHKKRRKPKTRRKNTSRSRRKGKDAVEQYAIDVLSGREIAGNLVKLACERHLRDLKDGPKRGLSWDWPAAERVIQFFPDVLRLNGGEFEGKPFELHPSQKFIVGSLFGWKGKDGYRRFRVGYVEKGKGNGKSPFAAGIGIYMLMADGEPRAEVYAAAVDKDQAAILFRDAVAMVDQSPALDSRIHRSGTRGKEWNLAYLAEDSFFRPISSEHVGGRGKSGFRPHCVLLDEVHEHPSDSMVEFSRANTKGRRQALIFMITNSGFDRESVCFHYHHYSEQILRGVLENDSFFAYVCQLDEGDDWKDPKVWPKANPLLGISIKKKYIEEQVVEALGMPSKQNLVRRLNFCQWTESANAFIDPDVWLNNSGKYPTLKLKGKPCFGGLDLSGKNDLTSLKLVFPLPNGKKAVLSFFWTPADTVRERQEQDKAPYEAWVRDGFLSTTPGKTISYKWVAAKLGSLVSMFDIKAIAFDRWRIDDLNRELDDQGVEVTLVPHGQGYKDMSPAIETLEDDLKETRLLHGGHPVLGWNIANAMVEEDPAGSRKFTKKKSTGRIDGAVALAMAVNLSVSYVDEGVDMDDVIENAMVIST